MYLVLLLKVLCNSLSVLSSFNVLQSHPLHVHITLYNILTNCSNYHFPQGEITEAQKSFYGKDDAATKEAPPKKSPPAATPVVTAQPAKATKTSDKVLKATEVAKDEVKKKGVQETKEKMSSKSSSVASSTPEPVEETTEEEVTEVEEVKEEKGTKRKLAKGVTLIVAAGVVAVARNVVKAWLGRGML